MCCTEHNSSHQTHACAHRCMSRVYTHTRTYTFAHSKCKMHGRHPPTANMHAVTHAHTHTHTHTTQKPSGAYCDVDLSLEGPQSLRYLCLHQWWQKRHMQGFRIFGIFWNTFIHLYGNTQRSRVNIKTPPFPSTPQTDTPAKNRRCFLFAW